MPGPGPGRHVTPIRLKGRDKTLFRYMSRSMPMSFSPAGGIQWASCATRQSGFRETPSARVTNGFNFETRGIQGGVSALGAMLAPGMAIAYHTAAMAVYSLIEPYRRLSGPMYVNITKPCR